MHRVFSYIVNLTQFTSILDNVITLILSSFNADDDSNSNEYVSCTNLSGVDNNHCLTSSRLSNVCVSNVVMPCRARSFAESLTTMRCGVHWRRHRYSLDIRLTSNTRGNLTIWLSFIGNYVEWTQQAFMYQSPARAHDVYACGVTVQDVNNVQRTKINIRQYYQFVIS